MPRPRLKPAELELATELANHGVALARGDWIGKTNVVDRMIETAKRLKTMPAPVGKAIVSHAPKTLPKHLDDEQRNNAISNIHLIHFISKLREARRPKTLDGILKLMNRVQRHPKAEGLSIRQIVSKDPSFFGE